MQVQNEVLWLAARAARLVTFFSLAQVWRGKYNGGVVGYLGHMSKEGADTSMPFTGTAFSNIGYRRSDIEHRSLCISHHH